MPEKFQHAARERKVANLIAKLDEMAIQTEAGPVTAELVAFMDDRRWAALAEATEINGKQFERVNKPSGHTLMMLLERLKEREGK